MASLHLASMAERLADDEDALDMVAKESFKCSIVRSARDVVNISRDSLVAFPPALRRRVLREAFERASGDSRNLNADHLEKMDHISLSPGKTGSYRLPSRWRFEKKGNLLTIKRCRTLCDRRK